MDGDAAPPPPAVSLPPRRSYRRAALAVAVVAIVGAVALASAWTTCGFRGCPDVDRLASYQPGGAPVLLDRDGTPFADLAPVRREMVALRVLPSHVTDAFLAIEDQRFREHGAVDWRRVVGALAANLRARSFRQGFS